MSKLRPLADYFMIELEANPNGFVGGKPIEEGIETGRIVDLSSEMQFFAFNTFAYDSSLVNTEVLTKLHDYYKTLVGKKVYWPAYSERGAVIDHEGKRYAMVKMSAISAVVEE